MEFHEQEEEQEEEEEEVGNLTVVNHRNFEIQPIDGEICWENCVWIGMLATKGGSLSGDPAHPIDSS